MIKFKIRGISYACNEQTGECTIIGAGWSTIMYNPIEAFNTFWQKESKGRKAEYIARISQLDGIIRTLYEDRVVGRISPERYDTLASDY